MEFKYENIMIGTKLIKWNGLYHKVSFCVSFFDDCLMEGTMALVEMPEVQCSHRSKLTGECKISMADEMICSMEFEIKDALYCLEDLSDEIA